MSGPNQDQLTVVAGATMIVCVVGSSHGHIGAPTGTSVPPNVQPIMLLFPKLLAPPQKAMLNMRVVLL